MPDLETIPAGEWNELLQEERAGRLRPGDGCRLHETADGVLVSLTLADRERHPWQLTPRWIVSNDPSEHGGHWAVIVRPGFVNGRDVTIEVVSEGTSRHLELTAEEPPLLRVGAFRDPAASAGVASSAEGDIVVLPGSGYPEFFARLGVVPVSAGGDLQALLNPATDPERTRQIRACDIILVTPRLGATQELNILDPLTEGQTVVINTTFSDVALRSAPSPHYLRTEGEWTEPRQPTDLERLFGSAVEPVTDELHLSTLWLVSPPDANPEALPDSTWTPYPQHRVFRNLCHGSKAQYPTATHSTAEVKTGLAFGIGDTLFAALLDPVNDASEAVAASLGAANFEGKYWIT